MNKSQAVMNIRSNKMMAAFMRGNGNFNKAGELVVEIDQWKAYHELTDDDVDQWDDKMLEYQRMADLRADITENGNLEEMHAANKMLQHYARENRFNIEDYVWWKKNMQRTPKESTGTRPVNQYSGSGKVSRAVDQAMESINQRFGAPTR